MKQITVNGYSVWVDEQAEIKEGFYYDCNHKTILKAVFYGSSSKKNCFKIIFADKEHNLEGVPTREEWLAESETLEESVKIEINYYNNLMDELGDNYSDLKHDKFDEKFALNWSLFGAKWQQEQSAKQDLPTWQDVEKAIELARETRKEKYSERFDNDKYPIGNTETWGNRLVPKYTKEEIINQLKNDNL